MAKPMTVSYGRLATFGRFENEKVSLTVELAEGETADQGLDQARKWVEAALAERDHLSESIIEMQTRVAELQGLESRLAHVVEEARKIAGMVTAPAPSTAEDEARSQVLHSISSAAGRLNDLGNSDEGAPEHHDDDNEDPLEIYKDE